MKTILRGILAAIVGVAIGSTVNMALVLLSPHVIPPPAGVDVNNAESLKASIHLFEPKHFLFPFLAHALGTLAGSIVAYLVAARYRMVMSLVMGVVFLAGGIASALVIPAPASFIACDLLLAYLPMAWLGVVIGRKVLGQPEST